MRVSNCIGLLLVVLLMTGHSTARADGDQESSKDRDDAARQILAEGKRIFRFDTFGDEAFWGGTIKLHEGIEGAGFGGVGPGVSPKTALAVGLKVDVDALPRSLVESLKAGRVNLDEPATTLALIKLKAVVGVTGTFARNGALSSIGIQCALCHSTVDNSLAPGIGHRLDGWANRDLNVGAIVALAPDLSAVDALLGVNDATARAVLAAWGAGKFDAELFLDGKGFRPDGKTAAVLIPPAFGLAGVNLHTWTGWGSVPYWNAFVAVLEMHGKGNFSDSRLDDAAQFPIAARAGFGHTHESPDLVSGKLPALQAYQLSLSAPRAPQGSYDQSAAARGKVVFENSGKCATCHVPPTFTEPGWNLHTGEEVGVDDFQANRSPDRRYRTTPLKGLWTHEKGGFYHDGRFATLADVIDNYDTVLGLGLDTQQKNDLAEYLKSL